MGSAGGLLLSAEPVNVPCPPGGPRLVPGDIFSVAGQTQLVVWREYSFATECFFTTWFELSSILHSDSDPLRGLWTCTGYTQKKKCSCCVSLSQPCLLQQPLYL